MEQLVSAGEWGKLKGVQPLTNWCGHGVCDVLVRVLGREELKAVHEFEQAVQTCGACGYDCDSKGANHTELVQNPCSQG